MVFEQKGAGASAREGSCCKLVNNDGSVVAAVLSEMDKVPPLEEERRRLLKDFLGCLIVKDRWFI